MTRSELCVKACEGLLDDDLEHLLSSGRTLYDVCKSLEELWLLTQVIEDNNLLNSIERGNSPLN